jgi:hypothetical protein
MLGGREEVLDIMEHAAFPHVPRGNAPKPACTSVIIFSSSLATASLPAHIRDVRQAKRATWATHGRDRDGRQHANQGASTQNPNVGKLSLLPTFAPWLKQGAGDPNKASLHTK